MSIEQQSRHRLFRSGCMCDSQGEEREGRRAREIPQLGEGTRRTSGGSHGAQQGGE